MLGDTAVAVHPEDERYKDIIGTTLEHPITGRQIPIIADDYVDPEFGTGAVKITPAHDPNDFEMGLRHDLPMPTIMDKAGRIADSVPALPETVTQLAKQTSAGGPLALLLVLAVLAVRRRATRALANWRPRSMPIARAWLEPATLTLAPRPPPAL